MSSIDRELSERVTKVIQTSQFPVRIKLSRGQRGSYGWEIDIQTEDHHSALFLVETIDAELRAKFASQNGEKAEDRLATFRNAPVKRSKHEEDVV